MKVNRQNVSRYGKMAIFLLLAAIAVIVVTRHYKDNPGGGGLLGKLSKPSEYQLNYLPADYEMNINVEDAVAIMNNPERYRKEFDQMVYDINVGILRHVGNRMGLSDSLKTAIVAEYDNHHPYLREMYFNDFIRLKDSTANVYETWYDNDSGSSIDVLKEIASKYTCFLVNQILATVIETDNGAIYAKGAELNTPCGIALTEALQPMIARMEERAAIEDFSRARGLLQEKVERVIAELATMEVQDKKGINKQMQTRIWGMNVSSSDLEITAISILKVGFRLNDYFDVELNSRSGIVTVTLPEPVILSHEVYPKIEKLDIGWLREVESVNFNESFNSLRREFRREAVASNIFDQSKQQAVELMNTMFGPLIRSMSTRYQLKVEFKANPNSEENQQQALDG